MFLSGSSNKTLAPRLAASSTYLCVASALRITSVKLSPLRSAISRIAIAASPDRLTEKRSWGTDTPASTDVGSSVGLVIAVANLYFELDEFLVAG